MSAYEKQVEPAAVSAGSVANLTLEGTDCNIVLKFSEDGQFHYDYDVDTFDFETKGEGSTKTIIVSKKAGIGNVFPVKFVTIQIPSSAYEQVNCILENVGVNVPAMNCNISVTAIDSSVTANIPANFSKTLYYHSTEGSGTIKLPEAVSNIKVKLDAVDSSVSIPSEWPDFKNGQSYTHQIGKDVGNILVNLNGCSFKMKYQ